MPACFTHIHHHVSVNWENILDIIPTRELLQKGYPHKNLHIIAVAGNYDEALLLAYDIVKET